MVLDSTHIQNFHGQTVSVVKMLLFLELIIVLLCMLIIKKDIFVLDEGPTQGFHDATVTAEAKYPINFSRSGRRFVLSLLYNGSSSFLFVNAMKMYQSKAKDSKTKLYPLCLGNISKNS